VKQKMLIEVRGKTKLWSFAFYADPQYLPEWEADGLQVFHLENTIPKWVVDIGMLRPWIWVQDAWRFLRFW
jgi:hypothetical protein